MWTYQSKVVGTVAAAQMGRSIHVYGDTMFIGSVHGHPTISTAGFSISKVEVIIKL